MNFGLVEAAYGILSILFAASVYTVVRYRRHAKTKRADEIRANPSGEFIDRFKPKRMPGD